MTTPSKAASLPRSTNPSDTGRSVSDICANELPSGSGALRDAWSTRLIQRAFAPCDIASLVVLRITLGLLLTWEAIRHFTEGLIESVYLAPRFHFRYLAFEWVHPLPPDGMYAVFVVLGFAATFVAIGLWYRLAMATLCVGWTYLLLVEKTTYLNHVYLVCLLTFLLCFIPAHRAFSVDAWLHPRWKSNVVPALGLWVMRAQIAIPYVFGALAKLNGDWLQGQPMQMWMSRMEPIREVIPAFGEMWLALVFSYGGFLLDLSIVPLLMWRVTRLWAFAAVVGFHVCNAMMFRIGFFPWLMIGASTIFFEPSWSRRVIHWLLPNVLPPKQLDIEFAPNRTLLTASLIWFAIHVILPFQPLLYPGDVDWTEEGSRFTWRMMLNSKTTALRIDVIDVATRKRTNFDPQPYLMQWQLNYLSYDPDLLVQFCHFVAEECRESHPDGVEVHVLAVCSLNGRRPQLLVDPDIDLSKQPRTWGHQPWIVPLREPLPEKPWDQPAQNWDPSVFQ